MECPSLLVFLAILCLVLQGDGAPNRRRSRAAKLLDHDKQTTRDSKLQDEFKEETTTTPAPKTNRRNKALNLFSGYFPSFLSSGLDYTEDDDDDVTFAVNDDHFDDDDLSRTIPSRRRQQNKKKNGNGDRNEYQNDNLNSLQYDNSPIFYIRLPPTPYMFVPGLGYVSQPPSLGPPMSPMIPPQNGYPQPDPFINLPLDFVSNGKPTGVYQWSGAGGYPQPPQNGYPQPPIPQAGYNQAPQPEYNQAPQPGYNQVPQPGYPQGPQAGYPQPDPFGYGPPQPLLPSPPRPSYDAPSYSKPKPKPPTNSKVTNLKGQYVFNGKPNDSVYVLRDTYNSIYSDALQNFYP